MDIYLYFCFKNVSIFISNKETRKQRHVIFYVYNSHPFTITVEKFSRWTPHDIQESDLQNFETFFTQFKSLIIPYFVLIFPSVVNFFILKDIDIKQNLVFKQISYDTTIFFQCNENLKSKSWNLHSNDNVLIFFMNVALFIYSLFFHRREWIYIF